jgi:hypothetical protein
MTQVSYQIVLISPVTGHILTVFDPAAFDEIKYSRVLNDVGVLAITYPGTVDRSLFSLDTLIEIYRTSPVTGELAKEDTYFVRYTQRFRQDTSEKFVVGGFSLNHLLARRIVDPDDDPLQAGGFSTKAGLADYVMRDYAREQAGDLASAERSFPGLTVPPVYGLGIAAGARVRHQVLLELLQDLASRGGVDFEIRRTTNANLELAILPIGTDKTKTSNYPLTPWVGLSPQRGNLSNPSLTFDRKSEQNFVYALGQGQAERRKLLKLAGDGITDSPYNRIEFVADIRTAENDSPLQLFTGAKAQLFNKRPRKDFTYEPTDQEPGNVYNQDWVLGDKVSAFWDEEDLDLRVTSVEITLSANNESVKTTLTEVPHD